MAAQKACGHDNLCTVSWIAFKFGGVVVYVLLMIWLTSGMNPLKTKWMPQPLKKKLHGGGGGNFFLFFLSCIHFYIGVVYPSWEKNLRALFSGGGRGRRRGNFFLIMNFFAHLFSTYDLCDYAILPIYFLGAPCHKQPFSKMAAQKACGHDNLWTVSWIAFKFGRVVL